MYLGIDTSNYTTSVALFDGQTVTQQKKLLSVKPGERGLRQSEALFQHTVQLPPLLRELRCQRPNQPLSAVGVSSRPRSADGSYMPCFLAGQCAGVSAAAAANIPLYETSHQNGHILAALYSAGRLDLTEQKFLAFHLSGGTTEALLVQPDKDSCISVQEVAHSSDLKAGQAVDRVGILLGLHFPAGKQLEALAAQSHQIYKIKPSFCGLDCSLSGIENQCTAMLQKGLPKEDIAAYCLQSIFAALDQMTALLLKKYGDLPLLYAGGVMSNKQIRTAVEQKYQALFAEPEFSCDNAAGTAIFAYLKHNQDRQISI